ncbi:MAG TPA: hypothetical protein VJ608_11650, partial [Albitalea sp.]|nr:hypothetical protein [Albitalea sp.]
MAIALLAGMSSSLVVAQSAVRVLDAQTQAQLIEAFGTQLKEHYVDAELAQQVSTDLQVRFAKGEYQNISDPEQFATLLTEQSRRISKDKHMVLRYVDEPVPHDGLPPSPAQRAKWTKALENVNFGVERVERLPGNIGYL